MKVWLGKNKKNKFVSLRRAAGLGSRITGSPNTFADLMARSVCFLEIKERVSKSCSIQGALLPHCHNLQYLRVLLFPWRYVNQPFAALSEPTHGALTPQWFKNA